MDKPKYSLFKMKHRRQSDSLNDEHRDWKSIQDNGYQTIMRLAVLNVLYSGELLKDIWMEPICCDSAFEENHLDMSTKITYINRTCIHTDKCSINATGNT